LNRFSNQSQTGYFLAECRSSVDDSSQPFALWVPLGYSPKKSWPLVVALHGSDADHRMIPEKCFRIHERGFDERAILLSPFGRGDVEWRWMGEADVWDAIGWVRKRYRIDLRRQYLTGLSLGGYAAWRMAAERPDYWAAIAPVCGGAEVATMSAMKRVPVWCVHGAQDPIVPVQRSRELVAELKRIKGKVRYDELGDRGHESWRWLYDPERGRNSLVGWFLKHSRAVAPRPVTKPKRFGFFNDLFSERLIIVPSTDTPIPREAEQLRQEAERVARFHFADLVMRSGKLMVKSDQELTEADAKSANLLFIGRTDNHAWMRRIERRLVARHVDGRLVFQGETLLGKSWAAATAQGNPWSRSRLLGVLTYQQRGQIAGLAGRFIGVEPAVGYATLVDTKTGKRVQGSG
jgi:pimeloyl-ACP methyl ester carboxylesterase